MLHDLVVDTNIFLHAQNPNENRCADSQQFLKRLLDVHSILCVDKGFNTNESQNRSHIGTEYLNNLRAGSLGLTVVVTLATQGRVKELARRAPKDVARRIIQIVRKPKDRVFLSVAYNSQSKVLVSHDYEDFQIPKRATIRNELKVSVLEANDCHSRL